MNAKHDAKIVSHVENFEAEFEPRILDNDELAEVAGAGFTLTRAGTCSTDASDPDLA